MPRLPAAPADVRLAAAWGRTIVSKKEEPHEKRLERILRDAEAETQDLVDLVVFVRSTPFNLESQPVEAVVKSFKSWWGGALPNPWRDMEDEDLAKAVWSASAATPMLDKAVASLGKSKTANAFMVTMVAVTVAARKEEERKEAERYRKEMMRRKGEEDETYRKRTKGYDGVPKSTLWSSRDGKMHEIPTDDPKYTEKVEDVEFDNHVWACERLDVEPLSRDKWKSERGKDTPDGWKASHLYSRATIGLESIPEKKKAVKEILDDYDGFKKRRLEDARMQNLYRINAGIEVDEKQRLVELIREEKGEDSLLDSILADFAPKWSAARMKTREDKATARAKERQKAERAESESARTYKDYVESKKKQGRRPMPEADWEARYKSARLLVAAWGRTIHDLDADG